MHARSGSIRLSHFRVTCAGGGDFTSKLYANGRHQCEVVVEVGKEVLGEDNVWRSASLTHAERDSVTLVSMSEHSEQALSPGWSCDKEHDVYTLGLWSPGASTHHEAQESFLSIPGCEAVHRYLRFDSGFPVELATFMARISVGGEYFTTDSPPGGATAKTLITVTPVRPFKLNSVDFVRHVDYFAYTADQVSVAVFYWVPPVGIDFVKNLSLADPVDMPSEGDNFKTSQVFKPVGMLMGTKVGVVLNKDALGARLYMNDVSKGLLLPEPNPEIPFDRFPTIVRVVRVYSRMSTDSIDTRSLWTLLDNYGNEHGFILDVGFSGEVHLESVDAVRLSRMKIVLTNDQSSTNALYANDRHQCKVQIEVLAEREDSSGNWAPIILSERERNSATVTRYSANSNEPLPPGWSCDRDKNIYDTGLWGRGRAGHEGVEKVEASTLNDPIDRYMRFNSTTAIENQRLMGKITIAGSVYTTNSASGGVDSSINILPTRPYILRVADLVQYADDDAQRDAYTDVDVYYYSTPSGIRILSNRGIDSPLSVVNNGDYFHTALVHDINLSGFKSCKIGVVISKDVPGLRLRIADIQHGINSGNPYVEFNLVGTIFRAVRLWSKSTITGGNTNSPWRLWDNFGCEHVFTLASAEGGRHIELRNA